MIGGMSSYAAAAAPIPDEAQPIPVVTDDIYLNGLGDIEAPAPIRVQLASPEFKRAFRFGVIDNAALVAFTVAGISIDDFIADAIGVPGYGALVGAVVGNAVSDGLAGLPEGRSAALGYLTGALLPGVPIAVAMLMKKELSGTTKTMLLAASGALLALSFVKKNAGSKTA